MLRYETAGDERVRASHKALDGVVKPVGSPFWDQNAPLNGWNCRCDLVQVVDDEEEETPDKDIEVPEDIPDYMKINPGKQKIIYSPEHPYFVVDKQFSKLRDNNFNLPDPPKVSDKEIKEAVGSANKIKLDGFKGLHTYGTLKGKKLDIQKKLEKEVGFKIPDNLIKNANENIELLQNSPDGPHYNILTKKLYLGHNESGWKNGGDYYRKQLVAHELGHSIHVEKGEVNLFDMQSDSFKEVKDVMSKELKEIAKRVEGVRGRGESKALRFLANEMRREIADAFDNILSTKDKGKKELFKKVKNEFGALDDTIQAYSKGSFGSGHTKAYQKSNGNKEIFAHLNENYYVGNDIFKKYLPKTYAKGLEYIESLQ